jgi:hypothetical protein
MGRCLLLDGGWISLLRRLLSVSLVVQNVVIGVDLVCRVIFTKGGVTDIIGKDGGLS